MNEPFSVIFKHREIDFIQIEFDLILGEAIPVPLENPAVIAEQEKYEKIINDEVVPTLEQEPYDRIPAECFTRNFDCETDSQNMCCAYIE